MALLHFFTPPCLLSSSSASHCSFSSSSTTLAVIAAPISRLYIKPIDIYSNSLWGICFDKPFSTSRRGGIVAKASLDIGETGPDGEKAISETESDDDDEENIPFDKIPLDSKLQLKLEQKMRMKVAKKVRLRRKKLIRKRRMRKTGRWSPSKMKKLKNV